jgi:hypothetical protein
MIENTQQQPILISSFSVILAGGSISTTRRLALPGMRGAGLDVRTGYREDICGIRTVDRGEGAAYLGMKILLTRRYAMSELLKIDVLRNFKRVEASGGDAVMNRCAWRARKFAGVGFAAASSLLLVAFCVAPFTPVAQGQNQAGAATSGSGAAQSQGAAAAKPAAGAATQPAAASAQTPAQSSTPTSAQPSAAKSTDAAAPTSVQTEPQMQDQSAPPTESLGEAARRARAQKAKTATAKVYSEDSVSSLSGHGVSVVGDGKTGGGSSYGGNAYAGAPASAAGNNQESYWRGRANAIRAQMAACDQRISEIQDEIAKHGAVSVDPMSGAQAGVIFVEDRNAQIKQVENQKAGFERQLEELAEEGRKAGADSGWFR